MLTQEKVRLQKYLSRCGIASRRRCETLIDSGRVSVNDLVVTKMGSKVIPGQDVVKLDGQVVDMIESDVTIVLNKPAGYVSTMNDPQGRPCVADLVPIGDYPNLFPVGRLDRMTSGMLIFTTDGQLGQRLLHPKHEVDKIYRAVVVGNLKSNYKAITKLQNGIDIGDFVTSPAQLNIIENFDFARYQIIEKSFFENSGQGCSNDELPNTKDLYDKDFTLAEITIHEGKNRQVRRMFEAVGFHVLLLKRVKIGQLEIGELKPGNWNYLQDNEIKKMEEN